MNEPKLATKGRKPSKDKPAAIPIPLASAIPTSKDLCGNFLKKYDSLHAPFKSILIETIFLFFFPCSANDKPNASLIAIFF